MKHLFRPKELAGVKSAQSTFGRATLKTVRTGPTYNGKASKSELTQTAEELTSKIASVQVATEIKETSLSTGIRLQTALMAQGMLV